MNDLPTTAERWDAAFGAPVVEPDPVVITHPPRLNWFQHLRHELFNTRYVILTDFDGEETIRPTYDVDGELCCTRCGCGVHRCILIEDGVVFSKDATYCHTWRDAE